MDDIREIEAFLYQMKEAVKNSIYLDYNTVYANLVRFGRKVVNNKRIEHNFPEWIDYFKYIPNINVFVQDNWRYLCQFTNDDYHVITPTNMIKMYIPVDDAHINEAAKRIFNFMSQNKMIHHSKIGSEVRFDDIVIIIDSEENAKKVENFVMNDPYIREGLMKPNPFAFNNGYISYAWDGNLSFNQVVSKYISNYLNELKDKNQLDSASYKGLVEYIAKLYNAVFKDHKYIDNYMTAMCFDDDTELDNYKRVTELLLESMMPDKKDKDFFQVYRQIVFDEKEEKEDDTKLYISDKQKAKWDEIYKYLVQKYGYQQTHKRIHLFLETGDYNYFTRDNNIRSYLMSNISKDMLQVLFLESTKEKRDILNMASGDTYQKYDANQLFVALKNATRGYYMNFTNMHGGRDQLEKKIKPEEIYGLVISAYLAKGYDIKEIPKHEDILYEKYIEILQIKENRKRRH